MEHIDSQELKNLVSAGYIWLKNKSRIVDDLNVFPVPDGDTGTNMCFALKSVVDELSKIEDIKEVTVGELLKIIAEGSLMGARGNSGVILSQFFYGLSCEMNSNEKISISELADALHKGSVYAYRSVSNPVEGTILTVMREMSQTALENKDTITDITLFFEKILIKGKEVLNKTPDMLPVLKEAGVVDAGGCGFIFVMEGMLRCLKGKSLEEKEITERNIPVLINIWEKILNLSRKEASEDADLILQTKILRKGLKERIKNIMGKISLSSINLLLRLAYKILRKFHFNNIGGLTSISRRMVEVWKKKPEERYCLGFILKGENLSKDILSDKLKDIGSSIIIAGTNNLLKVHIHTNKPEETVKAVSLLGDVSKVKIDDMYKQQNKFLSDIKEDGKYDNKVGVIAVASGKGWKEVFKSSGVSYIIEGGKTMNPSVREILKAVEKVDFFNIILLPNDSNVLLSAQQAIKLTDKNVEINPSRTMPEGISSLLFFNPEYNLEENKKQMETVLDMVSTGMVAKATRSVKNGNFTVKRGDYIGLAKKGIIARGNDYQTVALDTIKKIVKKDSNIITIYWGRDSNKVKAKSLYQNLKNEFPDIEIQLYYGGQFYYYYIVSVE
ncbi:MAG: DAK2 domain-containing protein [Actinobacteria bacterium]|nr:DAK2 domain-containing protein [Actinomycetota bacterium]